MVASKTEKQNDSKKREWSSVTTEEDVSSDVVATPQTINHVVNETQEKTIPSEEKKAKTKRYQKNGWMTRKTKDDSLSREKEKEEKDVTKDKKTE